MPKKNYPQLAKPELHLLTAILTSGDFGRLARAIDSVECQTPSQIFDIKNEIVVIVNTQDPNYANEVLTKLSPKGYTVVVTESDGTPGTGKNSVFDYFRERTEKGDHFDYLFQIDGDDFLYPSAFWQLTEVLKKSDMADVISFQSMDWLSTNFTEKMSYAIIEQNKTWLYSWCQAEPNLREASQFVYVTDEGFGTTGRIFTPGTTMFLSRKFLVEYPTYHTNEIKLFEDYLYYLKVFKLHLDGKIKMCHINNSFLYVYDKTNENSVSTHNCFYGPKEINLLKGFVQENDMMEKTPATDMEFYQAGEPRHFSLRDKIIWVKYMTAKYPVKMKSLDIKEKVQEQKAKISQQMVQQQPERYRMDPERVYDPRTFDPIAMNQRGPVPQPRQTQNLVNRAGKL